MDSLTLKRHDSFQNVNNRTDTHKFAPRPLIFKLQQIFFKFSDICLSWVSPTFEERLENVNFAQ